MAEEPAHAFPARSMTETHPRDGLADLADRYDGFIVDLWGVLHDGVAAFPAALDCLSRLKDRGKRIVVLSNAPRRAAEVEARNLELGIGARHVDATMSSGEATWRSLSRRGDPWYAALGERCHQIGPPRDRGMRAGLSFRFVETVEQADFLLATGADRPEDRAEDFDRVLDAARARGLPMICANPDLEVIRGGRREICAGTIADRYEAKGGFVRYHGKPHADVYDRAFDLLGLPDRRRIAAIGDSLRTDVAGARAVGIDAIFVTGGIHCGTLRVPEGVMPARADLEALFARHGQRPTEVLPALRW